MDEHLKETRLESELAYEGSFLKVHHDTVRLPNGKTASREYIPHPGAVVILPVLDNGRLLLERQYRYPVDQVFIEFPAGKIDPGEDPLVCAKRELLEETGYTATHWQFVCKIHNAIAYSDEFLDIYIARGLTAGERKLDDEEFLDVFDCTPQELTSWVRAGRITDVKTIIGSFWLEKILSGGWQPIGR